MFINTVIRITEKLQPSRVFLQNKFNNLSHIPINTIRGQAKPKPKPS